jgi:regulator of protease activity HflC (stomatin/prohibitin superfamily)
VAVPVGSTDIPFIFQEQTADYQNVSLQGQITYRIAEPGKLAAMMNFTLDPGRLGYASEDPERLPQRVINLVHVLARAEIEKLTLRDALRASESLVTAIRKQVATLPDLTALGLEVLGLSLLAIKPNPETARALEAVTREQLLRGADEAIYVRRNAAVEQERGIKENELNTEIAVENKKRQIRETQMDAERAVQEKQAQLERAQLDSDISLEEERRKLVTLAAENARLDADARAYALSVTMKALQSAEPSVLQALTNSGMKPQQLIAQAFQELAAKADKIGTLNISPDLLSELLDKPVSKK